MLSDLILGYFLFLSHLLFCGCVKLIHFHLVFFRPDNQTPKWYKFDDGDVSECKMDDDEVGRTGRTFGKYNIHLEPYAWSEICHACSKPVAWKGAHCCGYGPYTCTLIKNPMMMMMHVLICVLAKWIQMPGPCVFARIGIEAVRF